MEILQERRHAVLALAAALAGCAPLGGKFYDAAPIDAPGLASCAWTRRYTPPIVYQESDFVRAFLEPADLAAYREAIPAPFSMPPRPMLRVSVLHFYEMVNGPVYLESELSVLVLHEGKPGWFVLTMPVTDGDACAAGRSALGTPKVMRRITLERNAEHYVGTSYARDGRTPEFTLRVDVREPRQAAHEVLSFATPLPDYYLLRGRVLTVGGMRRPLEEMAKLAPEIWKARLGEARLDFSREPGSLLHRLDAGQPLAAYWGRLRYRYSITPQ